MAQSDLQRLIVNQLLLLERAGSNPAPSIQIDASVVYLVVHPSVTRET